jgi:AcrR family transcriptional regulator
MALATSKPDDRRSGPNLRLANESELQAKRRSSNADAILELAIAVIDEHGEAGIRVQELSDEVGVAITTLYRFFGSREGLIETAQAERFRRQATEELNRLKVAIELSEGAEEFQMVFRRSLERILSADLAAARMHRLNVVGSAQSRADLRIELASLQEQVNLTIAEVLERAQTNGWIRRDLDLVTFAAWFTGLANSRSFIELGLTSADGATWDRLTLASIESVLFDR